MSERDSPACQTWRLFLQVLAAERDRLPVIAAELGLSEAQCRVLEVLDPSTAVAMCSVARALDCDPSNITGIVDRMEARGLVERVADRTDRRVKKLTLTRAGKEHRARLLERTAEPPAQIRSLSVADQRALCAILQKVKGIRDG